MTTETDADLKQEVVDLLGALNELPQSPALLKEIALAIDKVICAQPIDDKKAIAVARVHLYLLGSGDMWGYETLLSEADAAFLGDVACLESLADRLDSFNIFYPAPFQFWQEFDKWNWQMPHPNRARDWFELAMLNPPEAAEELLIAADELGSQNGAWRLGVHILKHDKSRVTAAAHAFRNAMNRGSIDAMFILSELLRDRPEADSADESKSLLKQAARRGHIRAQYRLAIDLEDAEDALYWFEQVAARGTYEPENDEISIPTSSDCTDNIVEDARYRAGVIYCEPRDQQIAHWYSWTQAHAKGLTYLKQAAQSGSLKARKYLLDLDEEWNAEGGVP